jgi:NodT family efflux transporter outer membrane factor (OMF) lipoprotein
MRSVIQFSYVIFLGLSISLSLSSCNLAPTYVTPKVEVPTAYKAASNQSWVEAQPKDAANKDQWWKIYNDPVLDTLEDQVSHSNLSLEVADANFRTSRALALQARASLFPVANVAGAVTRQGASKTYSTGGAFSNGDPYTQYNLPVDASYTLDLWGRVRNSVSASVFAAQASAADLQTAKLSIQAELANDYFGLRAVDEQKSIYEDTVASYAQTLTLTKTLVKAGIDSEEDLGIAQTQYDNVIAQAADLDIARTNYENAIAVLVNKAPAEFSLPKAKFDVQLDALPVGVPSLLLQRRADIASAERRVASANAQIGIARSAYFPNLSLSANLGVETSLASKWFETTSKYWSLGPQFGGTVFDVGGLRGINDQAKAQYDAAVANYRLTVLSAFESVEDNLNAIQVLSKELDLQQTTVKSAEHTFNLSLTRFKAGIDSSLNVSTAENALLNARQAALQVKLRKAQASIALVIGLGGGWEVSDFPTRSEVFSSSKSNLK